jgi:hypothetical protein
MKFAIQSVALLLAINFAVLSHAIDSPPTIDLGWIRASEKTNGWLVAYSSQVPRNGNAIVGSDLVVSVDGQQLPALNPISVANLLQRISVDAVSATVIRNGKKRLLGFTGPNRLLSDAYYIKSNKPIRLYESNEDLPSIVLPDVGGAMHSLSFRGKWTVLRVGSFFCDVRDLEAFNEVSKTPSLQFAAITEYDDAASVRKLMEENKYTFPVLLSGDSTFVVDGEKRFDTDTLPVPGSGTYLLITPAGKVVFVSYSGDALRAAWVFLKSVNFAN